MIEVEMTSLEIANKIGKEHKHVRELINKKLLPLLSEDSQGRGFDRELFQVKTGSYTNIRGRAYDVFVLNPYAVNALMSHYSLAQSMIILTELHSKIVLLERTEKELAVMKNIVWKVINNKSFISREYALKSAGINHPRLFMKYLRSNESFYSSVLKREFLKDQHVSPSTKVLMFTQDGFQWLLGNTEKINSWVEDNKKLQRCIL